MKPVYGKEIAMFKVAMVLVVGIAFTACATAPAATPPPSMAKAGGCDWPAYMDKNERFAKGNMGGATPKMGMFNCAQ